MPPDVHLSEIPQLLNSERNKFENMKIPLYANLMFLAAGETFSQRAANDGCERATWKNHQSQSERNCHVR